ncbi:fructose facilitator [Bimuria novae-zelandiae CBS 107.79]|uniref:Fructose facilitator n=1 Tax=Bimuria novae-zelandiae CBS 107.79 TaxID=1447943 RepID=A0A6A5VBU0_9PLEO|nr:fructose facilitator [Bimuria novae-zelandiae CBS 107.79]
MSYYGKSFKAPPSRPTSLASTRANSTGYFAPQQMWREHNGTTTPRAASMYTAPTPVTNLSRANSTTEKPLDADPSRGDSVNSTRLSNAKRDFTIGRVVGGKYIDPANDELDADCGPIKTVEGIDMPLTLTEIVEHDGKEFIVLTFATGDPENPFNWNPWYKRSISTMLNLMTLFIGLATTAYSSGIGSMCAEFGVPEIMGQLGLFTFNMACALTPMVLAPLCELAGRKIVYAGAFLCFSLIFIGLALAKDISTIIGLRLLLGLFGCVGTILVGGTFDDMYEPHKRGRPMAMFSFVAIFGTVAAPTYAGFIDQAIGWRWIEGIQGLANIPLLIAVFAFFPETRGGVFLHKRAKKLREATGDERYVAEDDIYTPDVKSMLRASSVKAIRMLVTEPVVFAFGLWIAFCWAVVFLFLSVIPITFQEKRGWSEGVSGLPYISLAVGTFLGWVAHHFQMRRYDRLQADPNVNVVPEHRLYGSMFGAVWLPIGLFIYSFTQYGYLSWVGPVIGLAPIAFGIYFVFESTYSYTADCYGENSSSVIAGQGLMRNTLGAVTPLFASAFFHNVGSQYAGLILALFGTFLSMIPFVMFKFGHKLRARSKLAKEY